MNNDDKLIEIKKYLIRNYHCPKLLLIGLDNYVCNDFKKLFPIEIIEVSTHTDLSNVLSYKNLSEKLEWCEAIIYGSQFRNEIECLKIEDKPVIMY